MSWINPDSAKLINTHEAVAFATKNHLTSHGLPEGLYFSNKHVLIHIYEERTYVHADYYDLKNARWQRELQGEMVELAIPELDKRKKLVESFASVDDVLKGKSMQQFRFTLYAIDNFMQDFLAGDFTRYQHLFRPLEGNHKLQIEKLVAIIANT